MLKLINCVRFYSSRAPRIFSLAGAQYSASRSERRAHRRAERRCSGTGRPVYPVAQRRSLVCSRVRPPPHLLMPSKAPDAFGPGLIRAATHRAEPIQRFPRAGSTASAIGPYGVSRAEPKSLAREVAADVIAVGGRPADPVNACLFERRAADEASGLDPRRRAEVPWHDVTEI